MSSTKTQRQNSASSSEDVQSSLGRRIYRHGSVQLSRRLPKLVKSKWVLFSSIGIISLTGLLFISKKADSPINDIPLAEAERPIEGVAALGQLVPFGDSRVLAAPVSGFGGTPRISKLLINEGDQIDKGQVLAIFDNRPRLEADLEVSKARLQTLLSNISFQKREVDRYKETSREGASAFSIFEEKLDQLNILEGKRNEIIAEIKGLEIDLGYTQLKSPIDGVVLRINARPGERPGNEGVLEVASNHLMEALIEVYESDINRVRLGQNVSIISENGGFDGTLLGKVTHISPQVRQRMVLSTDPTGDADARVIEVRISLQPTSSDQVTRFTGMKVIARFIP
ncbi:possible ABC transporter component [Prochlorococcus marinus str. MIT 9211]|uniref:Possible ABC transporter component n=1 Tax=Prochlorococcus marinus (strain MIT 9211) TaxID=93059 RepID=A9BAT4_PROM4|nr:possible ABC transporter component [Prochlorococcus marinus str. MIT 9211]